MLGLSFSNDNSIFLWCRSTAHESMRLKTMIQNNELIKAK